MKQNKNNNSRGKSEGTLSSKFRNWLLKRLEGMQAGNQLPTGKVLAKEWNLSEGTVRQVLRSLGREGKLVLIAGKGTFVPSEGTPNPELHTPENQDSENAVINFVLHGIREGELRRGQALPARKYFKHKFKLAPSTVSRAYKKLEDMGLATQIGKTFWIGHSGELLRDRPKSSMVLFHSGGEDLTPLFRDDWNAPAFTRMESELREQNVDLQYHSLAEFSEKTSSWLRSKNFPDALIFSQWKESDSQAEFKLLGNLMEKRSSLRTLVDWASGDFHLLPRNTRLHVFSRGNLFTTRAKQISEFALRKGFSKIVLVLNEKLTGPASFLEYARIRTEWQALDTKLAFNLIIQSKSGDTKDFFKRLNVERPLERVERILSKYHSVSQTVLENETLCYSDDSKLNQILEGIEGESRKGRPKNLYVFAFDAMALEYQGLGVKSLLSLENSPRYFHHRLTCCVPDWDQIGYLMAHSLIGDFHVARSRRGFIKAKCVIVDRGSC